MRSIQPSPDGDEFAIITDMCGPLTTPFKTWTNGQLRDLISPCCSTGAGEAGFAWSPDGKRIAVLDSSLGVGGVLRTVNPDGSNVRTLIHREVDGTLVPGE